MEQLFERKPKINCLYGFGEDFIWWFLGSEIGYFVVTLMVTSLVTLFSLLSFTKIIWDESLSLENQGSG